MASLVQTRHNSRVTGVNNIVSDEFRAKILPIVLRRKIPAKIHRAVLALNEYLSFLTNPALMAAR